MGMVVHRHLRPEFPEFGDLERLVGFPLVGGSHHDYPGFTWPGLGWGWGEVRWRKSIARNPEHGGPLSVMGKQNRRSASKARRALPTPANSMANSASMKSRGMAGSECRKHSGAQDRWQPRGTWAAWETPTKGSPEALRASTWHRTDASF